MMMSAVFWFFLLWMLGIIVVGWSLYSSGALRPDQALERLLKRPLDDALECFAMLNDQLADDLERFAMARQRPTCEYIQTTSESLVRLTVAIVCRPTIRFSWLIVTIISIVQSAIWLKAYLWPSKWDLAVLVSIQHTLFEWVVPVQR